MQDWKSLFRNSIETGEALAKHYAVDPTEIEKVNEHFQFRLNPYYQSLIRYPGDPIWKQVIPDAQEIQEENLSLVDPLNEEGDMPVPGITHRYPDRVLFMVSHECPIFCRFCTRKRKVGQEAFVTRQKIDAGIEYIRQHAEIRDIILSGGDPLSLSDEKIDYIPKIL